MAIKKKQAPKSTPKNSLIDVVKSELIISQALEKQRFKDAIVHLKKLVTLDSKYLPKLILCYQNLIDQSFDKKDYSEVKKQIMALKEFALPQEYLSREINLAVEEGRFNDAARLTIAHFDSLAPESRWFHCDTLLLSDIEINKDSIPDEKLCAELLAVQSALQYVSNEQYEEVAIATKIIGLKSPVSHWKLFVKGVCAYYTGDDSTAIKAFGGIPINSLLFGTVTLFLNQLNFPNALADSYRNKLLLEKLCILNGFHDLKTDLPRAEYLWHSGRFRDSLKHILLSNGHLFSDSSPLLEDLSCFYMTAAHLFSNEKKMKYAEDIIDFSTAHLLKMKTKDPFFQYLLAKLSLDTTMNYALQSNNDAHTVFKGYSFFYQNYRGKNPKAEALIEYNQALYFAELIEPEHYSFFHRPTPRMRDEKFALTAFETAFSLDPYNETIAQSLLKFYEQTKNSSARIKLLDSVVVNFPENKNFLVKAGLDAIDRKAFKKGFTYLEKANKLDPLDKNVREELVRAYCNHAIIQAKSGKMHLYRELFALSEPLTDTSSNMVLGKHFNYIKYSALEYSNNQIPEAESCVKKAYDSGANHFEVLYYQYLFMYMNNITNIDILTLQAEVRQYLKSTANPENGLISIKILTDMLRRDSRGTLDLEKKEFNAYLQQFLKTKIDLSLLEKILQVNDESDIECIDPKLLEKLCEMALKQDSNQPMFRFFLWNSLFKNLKSWDTPDIEGLEKINEEAKRLFNRELIEKTESLLKQIMPKFQESRYSPFDFDDDDIEELINRAAHLAGLSNPLPTKPKPQPKPKSKPDESKPNKKSVPAEVVQQSLFDL